jgi:hypothetical protein
MLEVSQRTVNASENPADLLAKLSRVGSEFREMDSAGEIHYPRDPLTVWQVDTGVALSIQGSVVTGDRQIRIRLENMPDDRGLQVDYIRRCFGRGDLEDIPIGANTYGVSLILVTTKSFGSVRPKSER